MLTSQYIDTKNLQIGQPICVVLIDTNQVSVEHSRVKSITRRHFSVWCQGFKNRIIFDQKTGSVSHLYSKIILAVDPANLNQALESLQNTQIQTLDTNSKIPVLLPDGQLVFRKGFSYQGNLYINYQKARRRVAQHNGIYLLGQYSTK